MVISTTRMAALLQPGLRKVFSGGFTLGQWDPVFKPRVPKPSDEWMKAYRKERARLLRHILGRVKAKKKLSAERHVRKKAGWAR